MVMRGAEGHSCDSAGGHLGVDPSGDAGGGDVEVEVVLLVQAQVAVAQQVEGVDTPEDTATG